MQSEPSRYIRSVSDLFYSTDEIEFLLDDIRDLEPKSYKPEDIQDFEIAGSRNGVAAAGECLECDSPLDDGTVRSWDSHSHYRRRAHTPDLELYEGVLLYCDHRRLLTPVGFVRLLLVATTIACLACLCTSGTVKVGLFMLPLVGRIRLMMFITLISLFVTCVLLFLDISHIIYLFPFNWGKVNAYFYLSLSVLFLVASSLVVHMIYSDAFMWVPKWTHQQLLVTGCLGYACCLESALISAIQKCQMGQYQPVEQELSFHLLERPLSADGSPQHQANRTTHNYKPIVNYSVVASTSRHVSGSYLDDVQPCSSKSSQPHRLA